MLYLCKVLQVYILAQTTCHIIVAQAQVEVTELTSSLKASNRSFGCPNEEIVYCCVANSTSETMGLFHTTWIWNDTAVKTFSSNEIIGENNTCKSSLSLKFLHSTLVYTANFTCVSLLIVIPSLPNYENISVPIQCEATANGTEPHIMEIYHNFSSDAPKWTDVTEAENNINLSYDSYSSMSDTSTMFSLLNISWPGINNTDAMDFDCYALSVQIVDENNMTIYSFTERTNKTYYHENIVDSLPKDASSLCAQIEIRAINKCNTASTLQVIRSLNKGNIRNGSPRSNFGNDSSSKYAIILLSLAGFFIFHH